MVQIVFIGGIVIVLAVVSFVATCKANGKAKREEEDMDDA